MDQATIDPTAQQDGAGNFLNDYRQADQAVESDHNSDHNDTGAAGQAEAQAERQPVRPYTGKQLAGALAAFTAQGVSDSDSYKERVRSELADVFDQAGVGEALAELGIGHGGAMDLLPGWVRLAGAGVFAGYTVWNARAEHGRPVSVRPGSPVHRAWSWLRARFTFRRGGADEAS